MCLIICFSTLNKGIGKQYLLHFFLLSLEQFFRLQLSDNHIIQHKNPWWL